MPGTIFPASSMSQPNSMMPKRPSRSMCARAKAPSHTVQSATSAHRATTCCPSGVSSSSRSGDLRCCCSTPCDVCSVKPAASRSRKCPGAWANTPSQRPTCCTWRTGRASYPGRRQPEVFIPVGRRSIRPCSTWCIGAWSIAAWTLYAPSASTRLLLARGTSICALVYQIESDCKRLLWVRQERTKASFERFFTLIGKELGPEDRVRLH